MAQMIIEFQYVVTILPQKEGDIETPIAAFVHEEDAVHFQKYSKYSGKVLKVHKIQP